MTGVQTCALPICFPVTIEHRISGTHIISVVFPDNGVLDNYTNRIIQLGVDKDIIFFEEETDGDNSEPAEASE